MEIKPTNEVRLYKNVPFYIDYKDIRKFETTAEQVEFFNNLPNIYFSEITYTRSNGQIKVKAERDSLLDYNYMSFTNKNYTDKTFYAFITSIDYINPNTSLITFVIDEWQTWQFDLTFRDSFIERKHCRRWNSDGTPVINTQPESLEIGSEYIVKDHAQYNNSLYWICFVTEIENTEITIHDVPTILTLYYAPIYKTTNNIIQSYALNSGIIGGTTANTALNIFRNDTDLVNKLKSCFIISEPPFSYTYSIENDYIQINSNECTLYSLKGSGKQPLLIANKRLTNPVSTIRTYSKYGNLKNYVTESKLLMYPYSFVQLIDGQGNSFDIKNEYLDSTSINIKTFTSGGLNSKQAHILLNYRYEDVTLSNCRWELGNGIINSFPNNLTIIDDYSAAYLQGNDNQIKTSISNTISQTVLNNTIAKNTANAATKAAIYKGVASVVNGVASGATDGLGGAAVGAIGGAATGFSNYKITDIYNKNNILNTELQGNLTNEKATASALAKQNDVKNVADNVALQGGDVYFTFQNQYNGYCLVYKQISNEYILVLEDYFKKYGYAYNKIEIPNLYTRKSWDYIRCIDVNIKANINNDSLNKIKTMFNQGVTIWHTNEIGNYSLNNDEI